MTKATFFATLLTVSFVISGTASAAPMTFSVAQQKICKAIVKDYPNKFKSEKECIGDTQTEAAGSRIKVEFDICPTNKLVNAYINPKNGKISYASEDYNCEE